MLSKGSQRALGPTIQPEDSLRPGETPPGPPYPGTKMAPFPRKSARKTREEAHFGPVLDPADEAGSPCIQRGEAQIRPRGHLSGGDPEPPLPLANIPILDLFWHILAGK